MNGNSMIFIDTNVLVYAHDESDLKKSQAARKLLIDLINSKEGCISPQVIQEFCNVMLKKSNGTVKPTDMKQIIRDLLLPLLAHKPDEMFYIKALEIYYRYSLSYYDSAIVQAAIDLDCHAIYSEDMQSGTKYEKVRVINPFA
jgi:predicted nucleic acid-binding protein